jgi:hypothetical protein
MTDLRAMLEPYRILPRIEPLLNTDMGQLYYCPDEVWAYQSWRQLRALTPQTGYWPLIISASDLLYVADHRLRGYSVIEALDAAQALSAEEYFTQQPGWRYPDETLLHKLETEEEPYDPWNENDTTRQTEDYLGELALIPTTASWQIPAFVHFGAWNDCPTPAEHVAILRYWSERHGIELMKITADVLEVSGLITQPDDRLTALKIAWEQYAYCPDLLAGYDPLGLAARIYHGASWRFWWD